VTLGAATDNTLSDCLQEESFADFYCPAGAPSSSNLVLGTQDLLCRVCGIGSFTDSNPDENIITGTLSWGPLQKGGSIDESMIDGYVVAIVDECGIPLQYFGSVTKNPSVDSSCCNPSAYSKTITAETLPANYHSFVVLPEKAGKFIHGGKVVEILDVSSTTTTTTYDGLVSTNAACGMQAVAGSISVFIITALTVSLMHG